MDAQNYKKLSQKLFDFVKFRKSMKQLLNPGSFLLFKIVYEREAT